MKDFFKAFLSFGLATSIEKIIAFALLPYFTIYFSTEEYGIMDLLQVLISTIAIFAVLHLESALQRYYYEYSDKEKGSFIYTILSVVLFGSLLVSFLVFFFSRNISQILFQSDEYYALVQIAALQIPLNNLSMLCLVMLRFEKRNLHFLLSILIKVITSLLLIYIFLEVFDLGIKGSLYAQIFSSLISLIYMFYLVRRYLVLDFAKILLNKALKYSLPQFPARVGNILLVYSNRFFMVGVLSVSAIGIFSLSLKLASIVQLIYTTFVLAWTPFMFKKRTDSNHKLIFINVLNLASIVIFLLVILVSLLAADILQYFIAEEFLEATKYVGPLCLSFAVMIFREIIDIGPKYMEKTQYLSYTFFFSLLINILSLSFLVSWLGIPGIVLSLILTNTSLLILCWIVSNKLYPVLFEYNKFIMLALPAYFISIVVMYIQLDLWIKMSVGIMSTVLYGYYFKSHIVEFRKSLV